MTIQRVKQIADAKGSYFFSRQTMKFFGDTMKSLGTKTINGQVYVYRKHGRKAIWLFNSLTADFTSCTDEMSAQIYK